MNPTDTHPSAKLTALADGSLDSPALLERVAASPELRDDLERQVRAVTALRSVDLDAPAGLRMRIQAERVRARKPVRGRRIALGGALAAGLAAAALALTLAVPDAGPAGPTVVQAAQLAQLPPAGRGAAPGSPKLLDVTAFGLSYPDWGPGFGWQATGVRRDRLAGSRGGDGLLREGRPAGRLHDPRRASDRCTRRRRVGPARRDDPAVPAGRELDRRHLAAWPAHLRALRKGRPARRPARPRRLEGPPLSDSQAKATPPRGRGISPIPPSRGAGEARRMAFTDLTGTAL